MKDTQQKNNKQFELKDYEQFVKKAEKLNKSRINKQSESYMDYGLDEEEDIKKYERFIK